LISLSERQKWGQRFYPVSSTKLVTFKDGTQRSRRRKLRILVDGERLRDNYMGIKRMREERGISICAASSLTIHHRTAWG
jgi:hypothetical protein